MADEIRKLAETSKNTVTEIQRVTKTVFMSVENLSKNSRESTDKLSQMVSRFRIQ